MKYYSTNKQAPVASLEEAVVKGLAGDKGLYMPEYIDSLDEEVIANMKNQSMPEGEWISRAGHLEQVFQNNVQ